MSSFLEQLNLTPQERRIVVAIAVVVFVVLNMLMVWPHFSDLGRVRRHLAETRKTIQDEGDAIRKDEDPTTNGYKVQLGLLQRQTGGAVGTAQVKLQRTVSDDGIKTGVNISEIRPVTSFQTKSNAFYEEESVKITFDCKEAELVNFLINVGNDPAMIRVRELNLKTADANRYGLKGDAILTANYAKQPPKAAAQPAAPGKTPAGPARPGSSPNSPVNPNNAPGAQSPRRNT